MRYNKHTHTKIETHTYTDTHTHTHTHRGGDDDKHESDLLFFQSFIAVSLVQVSNRNEPGLSAVRHVESSSLLSTAASTKGASLILKPRPGPLSRAALFPWGGGWARGPSSRRPPLPVLVVDAPDGLDLGGLAVGSPVLPVLEVSAVPLALHDVLLAPVAGVLVAHEAGRTDGGRVG